MDNSVLTAMEEEIIRGLLKASTAWVWEGTRKNKQPVKINHAKLETRFYQVIENLYIDNFLVPALYRAYRIFRLIKEGAFGGEYKDLEYANSHFYTIEGENGKHTEMSCEDCEYDLQMQISEVQFKGVKSRDGHIRTCYTQWWIDEHPEYRYGNYNSEAVEALGVKPEFDFQQTLL